MTGLVIVILLAHVLIGIALVTLILLQQGKGADMGAAFGSGSSGGLFGSAGSGTFLSRMTAVFATLFFVTTLILTVQASKNAKPAGSVMEQPFQGNTGTPVVPSAQGVDSDIPSPTLTNIPLQEPKSDSNAPSSLKK